MEQIPFRIRIGVTGHRKNLSDSEALTSKIKHLFGYDDVEKNCKLENSTLIDFFKDKVPNNAKHVTLAYTLLSGIAEGADRIVAQTFLKFAHTKLFAILPLQIHDYEKDFLTDDSKIEFDALLNLTDSIIYTEKSLLSQNKSEIELHNLRNEAYLKSGHYIVDHCDILIAIWDGITSGAKGGTSDVINYAKDQKCPIIIISSTDLNKVEYYLGNKLSTEPLKNLIALNSTNINERKTKNPIIVNFSEFYNENNPEIEFLHSTRLEKLKTYLLPLFAKADLQALRSKKIFEYTGIIVYFLSFLSVIVILLAVIFHIKHLMAFSIECILLLSILFLIRQANHIGFHKKWLANRFLVEKLRSTVYLFVAGAKQEPLSLRQTTRRKYDHYGWAIDAYNEILNHLNQTYKTENEIVPMIKIKNYIKKAWITGQINFQIKYNKIHNKWNRYLDKGGIWLFRIALLLAFTHILLCLKQDTIPFLLPFGEILTFIALLLLPIAAALDGIRNQRGYSRNANRSNIMIQILGELKEKYDDAESAEELSILLKETDKIMLQENQDWMLLMQSSELELKP